MQCVDEPASAPLPLGVFVPGELADAAVLLTDSMRPVVRRAKQIENRLVDRPVIVREYLRDIGPTLVT